MRIRRNLWNVLLLTIVGLMQNGADKAFSQAADQPGSDYSEDDHFEPPEDAPVRVVQFVGSKLSPGKQCAILGTPIQGIYCFEITSKEDQVVVKKIVVNRGNCDFSTVPKLPVQMAFGEKLFGYAECNFLEVGVVTNLGTTTLSWDR